jgi:hypothetical protein
MVRRVLDSTVDAVAYFHERRLVEVFYDPIHARSRLG